MTKSANIKRKRASRGRPKDADCLREANGRKSRSGRFTPVEDATIVAISARKRHWGLSDKNAVSERGGTVLGRLRLSNAITEPMWQAGQNYLEAYDAYLRSIKSPRGLAVSNAPGDGGDIITPEYSDWAQKAIETYEEYKKELLKVMAFFTVERIVVRDYEASPMWIDPLHRGLGRLVKVMGLTGRA